jgi:protocatechuate 3,4-dioxygenase beta subunit
LRRTHVQLDEVFAGLDPAIKEVTVMVNGELYRGESHLFQVERRNGVLTLVTCGLKGPIDQEPVKRAIDYLRRWKAGETHSSVDVFALSSGLRLSDVAVTLSGPALYRGTTDSAGKATFERVLPGAYTISVSKHQFEREAKPIVVAPGGCPAAWIEMAAKTVVKGTVLDGFGRPFASLSVFLRQLPSHEREHLILPQKAETDQEGRFEFRHVAPGHYYLGTTLSKHIRSKVPRWYYPGQQSAEAAIPIEVKLGETIEDLVLTLPDIGSKREIKLCTVDGAGRPLRDAVIEDAGSDDPGLGGLGTATTDEFGCATLTGYSKVRYKMRAARLGTEATPAMQAEPLDIPAGGESYFAVLVLGPILL